jgi:hypothetical protein
MSAVHVICPFPPCAAEWTVGLHPGQSRVSVPFHLPEGFEGSEHYDVRCPGALTMYDCSTRELTLDPESDERIQRAYEAYLLRLARAADEQAEEERRNRAEYIESLPPHIGAPIGRPANLDLDDTVYFPVKARPDEGPQPGEAPHAPIPEGVEAHYLPGRDAAVDDSHAATVGLTRLAITQFGQAQEALSVVTDLLDRAIAAAAIAETNVQAGNSLVTSAVGTGAGKPTPAEHMAEHSRLAMNTLSALDGTNLHNAISVGQVRAGLAVQQLTAAVTNAQSYIGLLGG